MKRQLTDEQGNLLLVVQKTADGQPSVCLYYRLLKFDFSSFVHLPLGKRYEVCAWHLRQELHSYCHHEKYEIRNFGHMLQATPAAPVPNFLFSFLLLALEYWDEINMQ
jgi:hypothetical protein